MVDPSGKPVILRGCNLGNWLTIETWMLGGTIKAKDQGEITDILTQRFGGASGYALMETYRENYIAPRDLELVQSFGFNIVRLPFDYRLLQDEKAPYAMRADAFKWIDRALELAEQAGLYVIVDMHGVPAGQSNQHHTGRENQTPEIWDDPAAQARFIDLWTKLAARYKDRSVIAAYDLVNEPYADYKTDITPVLRPLMFKTFEAIRSTGDQHVVVFPGALGRGVYFYGDVRATDFQQFAFTEHFYPGLFGSPSTLASHAHTILGEFPAVQKYLDAQRAPMLVGEFNVVLDRCGGELMMRKYYDEFARRGWMGTMWSYKILSRDGGVKGDNWYMVTNAEPLPAIDINTDSRETIEAYFKSLSTIALVADEPLRTALTSPAAPVLELPASVELPKSAPAVNMANGWTGVAVGDAAGGIEAKDGRLIVTARGSDVFGSADNFYFVQRAAASNSKQLMTAQVDGLLESGAYAKAGVMIRFGNPTDKSYASAPFVMVNVFPEGGVALLSRPSAGGPAVETKRYPGPLPRRIGLIRDSARIVGLAGDDAGNWINIGDMDVSSLANQPAQFGLATTSHQSGGFTRAEFSKVELTSIDPAKLKMQETFQSPEHAAAKSSVKWNSWGSIRLGENKRGDFTFTGVGDSGVWQDVAVKPGEAYRFSVAVTRDGAAAKDSGAVELRLEATLAGKQVAIASREFDIDKLEDDGGASILSIQGKSAIETLRLLIRVIPKAETGNNLSLRFDRASLISAGTGVSMRRASSSGAQGDNR